MAKNNFDPNSFFNSFQDWIENQQYQRRKTPDNSHLKPENVQKEIDKITSENENKLSEALKHIENTSIKISQEISEWKKNGGKDSYRAAKVSDYEQKLQQANVPSDEITKLVKLFEENLKKEQDIKEELLNHLGTQGESLQSSTTSRTQSEIDNLKNQNKKDAWNTLSGGMSGKVEKGGQDVSAFGSALKEIAGENSFLGKIGGKFEGLGEATQGMSGKIGMAAKMFTMVAQVVTSALNMIEQSIKISQEENENNFNLITKKREMEAQMAMAELENQTTLFGAKAKAETQYLTSITLSGLAKYKGALESKMMSFTDITGSAYKALDTEISNKYALKKAEAEKRYELGNGDGNSKYEILAEKMAVKLSQTKDVISAEQEVAQIEHDRKANQLKYKKLQLFTGDSATYALAGAAVGSLIPGLGTMAGAAIGEGIAMVKNAAISLAAANEDYYKQLQEHSKKYDAQNAKIRQNFVNAGQEAVSSLAEVGVESAKSITNAKLEAEEAEEKAYANLSQSTDKKWEVAEHQANEMGISFGYVGEQLDNFKKQMFMTQISVSKFGKKMEDVLKMQDNYSSTTGRNVQLSTQDFNSAFAMGTFWGDDVVSQLDAGMEIFNQDVETSNHMFFKMHEEVSKMGLSSKKFGKDLVANLKLAEKYNFKNGVQGLMNMSKWAQNMRFNVSSMDGMLDKVQTGGLEGIIKQAAELQVLGGNFAMGADPFAMAYESIMDPESYAKRMNSMLAGQGYMKEDGSVGFGTTSVQLMRQYAESTGQDYKDVLNQARQQVKIGAIQSQLNPSMNFSEDQQAMIANKAQYKDGQWMVNLGNKKDEQGNDILTNVNDITPEDLQLLIDNSGKTLEETAAESLSMQQKQAAIQEAMNSTLMNAYDFIKEEHEKRIANVITDFFGNAAEYQMKVYGYMAAATEAQKKLSSFYNNTTPEDIASKGLGNVNTTLGEIKTQLVSIIDAIGAKYNITGGELDSVGGSNSLLTIKQLMDKNGGFDKAITKIQNDGDKEWYDGGVIEELMNALRADPQALLKVKDKKLKKELATLIYAWDDSGSTTDFDYQKNSDLILLMSEALGGTKGVTYNGKTYRFNSGDNTGGIRNMNDGIVYQNGNLARIDDQDQVLAAKNGGPIDKMLDIVAKPLPYDGFVRESFTNTNGGGNGKIEIPPIQININGSIQLNGTGGSIDITQQLSNDPNFIRSISQIISMEVEKKVNGGRVISPLNRNLSWNGY